MLPAARAPGFSVTSQSIWRSNQRSKYLSHTLHPGVYGLISHTMFSGRDSYYKLKGPFLSENKHWLDNVSLSTLT